MTERRRLFRIVHRHLVLLLVLLAAVLSEDQAEIPDSYFLYGDEADRPVIDYKPGGEPDPESPAFIFGPSNGYRVVEFYSPWCPQVS